MQKHCFGGFQPKLIAYLQWISTRISFFQIKVHVHEKEGKEEKRAKCLKFFGSTLKPRWSCSFGKVLKPISITSSIMRFISLPIYWIASLLSKLIYENLFSKKLMKKEVTLQHILGTPCNGMQPLKYLLIQKNPPYKL